MILSIDHGKLVAHDYNGDITPINTPKELSVFLDKVKAENIPLYRSSSIDFPDEHTTDPMVLALANYITGVMDEPITD